MIAYENDNLGKNPGRIGIASECKLVFFNQNKGQ